MPLEQALTAVLREGGRFGQILIREIDSGFVLCHREDENRADLKIFRTAEVAAEIARFDDSGNYRPLKTAPNLRRGWRLEVIDLQELRYALDHFYPGRLAIFATWKRDRLSSTPLLETLERQSGMYRVARKISDEQLDEVVAKVCRSNGGCLRTILWKRDKNGGSPSRKLPSTKFDPTHDQTGRGEPAVPLLCQEICSVLLNECRKAVKGETDE